MYPVVSDYGCLSCSCQDRTNRSALNIALGFKCPSLQIYSQRRVYSSAARDEDIHVVAMFWYLPAYTHVERVCL